MNLRYWLYFDDLTAPQAESLLRAARGLRDECGLLVLVNERSGVMGDPYIPDPNDPFAPISDLRVAQNLGSLMSDQPKDKTMYAGETDARQEGDIKPTRFRPRYRKLSEDELALSDAIKEKAAELEALFEKAPQGRYVSLALTDLEKSIMWAVKAITA